MPVRVLLRVSLMIESPASFDQMSSAMLTFIILNVKITISMSIIIFIVNYFLALYEEKMHESRHEIIRFKKQYSSLRN